jgi:hypothetical protein
MEKLLSTKAISQVVLTNETSRRTNVPMIFREKLSLSKNSSKAVIFDAM